MIRRKIKEVDLTRDTNLAWNSFVDLLAMEDYEELTDRQRGASLVFWYDAEVQSGGHLQYFLNSAGRHAAETLIALTEMDLPCQNSTLSEAIKLISEHPLPQIETVDEYVEEALEKRFSDLDSRYYDCRPQATDVLEMYLKSNLNEFIELV